MVNALRLQKRRLVGKIKFSSASYMSKANQNITIRIINAAPKRIAEPVTLLLHGNI